MNFGIMYFDGFVCFVNCEMVDEVKCILVVYLEFRELTKSDDFYYIDRVRSFFFCIIRFNDL